MVGSATTSRSVVTSGAVTAGPERDGFGSLAEAIDAVAAVDALLASLAASRAVLMSELGEWASTHVGEILPGSVGDGDAAAAEAEDLAAGIVADRLAEILRVSPDAAAGLVEESRALVRRHPRTLAALRGGKISYGHAQTILGYTYGLHRGGRAALETRLLRHARTATVAELSLIARTERERRLRAPRRRAARADSVRQRRQMSSHAGGSPACT
ncbi:DUF222 domain-containing protein [Myceligenerans pegani]|uniref:DUF222 domain-containing protein n=1 Tax=Myceligenerans pegani TaxID=2776917 RepID=A0ABR9MSN6_9MICO|nr:DUF222 domain-containing protein [Myceligenerans sp. TRM 65318]MBE1874400.1 hypothetical protein [Myceligenerans sp. TRM 65318]MBE3016671.1 hypothetical protein [Myceligenerans sp. TRM 65318]